MDEMLIKCETLPLYEVLTRVVAMSDGVCC